MRMGYFHRECIWPSGRSSSGGSGTTPEGVGMIRNERQYRFTKTQVKRFEQTLAELKSRDPEALDVHPLIAKAQVDAVSSQLADLREQLREYESLKSGKFDFSELMVVTSLPEMLVKARIARGMTQRDLAERIGLKEQQIQRYEATDYVLCEFGANT